MFYSREETAELLNVSSKYLCPSNFKHLQQGALEKGYTVISMSGKGKNAIFEIEKTQIDLPGEEWKSIPFAPDYSVSNLGRVKHPKGGISPGTNCHGYIRTRIGNLGQFFNHRLVMLTFNPIENPDLFAVDHINGKRNDNRLENLRWVFQSENTQFSDQNNTEMKEIIAKLVQKYGYSNTKEKLLELL